MALIYAADLTPSKDEIIARYLAAAPWFTPGVDGLERVGAYRFDDPDGQVGMEVHFVRAADDLVYQVPLTYRPAALESDTALITTMEHSDLGTRWVYDGLGDALFVRTLANVIFTGEREADLFDPEGNRLPATAEVRGSGAYETFEARVDAVPAEGRGVGNQPSTIVLTIGDLTLSFLHVPELVDETTDLPKGLESLTGSWNGGPHVLLATAARG